MCKGAIKQYPAVRSTDYFAKVVFIKWLSFTCHKFSSHSLLLTIPSSIFYLKQYLKETFRYAEELIFYLDFLKMLYNISCQNLLSPVGCTHCIYFFCDEGIHKGTGHCIKNSYDKWGYLLYAVRVIVGSLFSK